MSKLDQKLTCTLSRTMGCYSKSAISGATVSWPAADCCSSVSHSSPAFSSLLLMHTAPDCLHTLMLGAMAAQRTGKGESLKNPHSAAIYCIHMLCMHLPSAMKFLLMTCLEQPPRSSISRSCIGRIPHAFIFTNVGLTPERPLHQPFEDQPYIGEDESIRDFARHVNHTDTPYCK